MRITVLLVLLLSVFTIHAQHLSNGEDILFAFEVKQLDEFIERFNNEETLIKKYVQNTQSGAVISRTSMLKSLINQGDTTWDIHLISQFIHDIDTRQEPVHLNFLDPEWYAEVHCTVNHQNVDQKVTLIMKVENGNDKSSRWVIANAMGNFLQLPDKTDEKTFLNPVSQGTDFLGLDKALADKKNIRNYLPKNYKEDQLAVFLDHWKNGKIQFRQVDRVIYHFLQVDGWIFKVQNFQRKERNKGWLISALSKATPSQKREYKKAILQLN